jgi:hypothetical protein
MKGASLLHTLAPSVMVIGTRALPRALLPFRKCDTGMFLALGRNAARSTGGPRTLHPEGKLSTSQDQRYDICEVDRFLHPDMASCKAIPLRSRRKGDKETGFALRKRSCFRTVSFQRDFLLPQLTVSCRALKKRQVTQSTPWLNPRKGYLSFQHKETSCLPFHAPGAPSHAVT